MRLGCCDVPAQVRGGASVTSVGNRSGRGTERLVLWLLTAQAIGFVAAGVAGFTLFPGHHDDLRVYIDSSRRVDEGQMPYRDFTIEYPPLALVPFTLPRAFATRPVATAEQYRTRFILVMAACST